jgi:oligoribonuclease
MDLEMTGLDPGRDVIVEIATLVTDDDLVIKDDGLDLVVHQPDDALAGMEDVVREMHTSSGLVEEIRRSTISLEDAGRRTLDYIKLHVPEARSVPLCGNSIGTDRRFLATYLPEIEEYLHYRSIDVSSVKELAKRWFPKESANAPAKVSAHRALGDIRESVAELLYYRDAVFKTPTTST